MKSAVKRRHLAGRSAQDRVRKILDREPCHGLIRPNLGLSVDVEGGSRALYLWQGQPSAILGSMIEMSLPESQLFRMLASFFGRDNVVFNMSVRAVCGGEYPPVAGQTAGDVARWADSAHCLFTLVDGSDMPKMVVEIAPDFTVVIELDRLERHKRLPMMLESCGVQYIVISQAELDEMLDPSSSLDLVSFLKDKFGIDEVEGDESGDDDGSGS